MKKKVFSAVLSVLLLCSFFTCFASAADEPRTVLSNAAETNAFAVVSRDFTDPMRLVPATLTRDGEETEIWFAALLGVKPTKGQVNVTKNTFAASFNRMNPYYAFVKETLLENVPAGAKRVIAGHSLGGMVAQQLRTDAELKETYEILNVVTCGSPFIMVKEAEAEGALNRMCDVFDAVPFLSPATLIAPQKQFGEAHRENGGYFLNPDGAHNDSYSRAEIWGKYDALGVPGGNASISFDAAAVTVYGAAA